jgi:hypothetical protein
MKASTKNSRSKPVAICMVILMLLTMLLGACGTDNVSDSMAATVSAIRGALAGTATAEQLKAANAGELAAAQAEATQQSLNISATQTAQYANRDVSGLATATLTAPIVAELPSYGLNASSGRIGWIHDTLTLEIRGYQEFTYGNDFMNVTASNFVLAADVTWNTQYGDSGCGFMFRSNGDQQKPDQYMVIATRFAEGHVIFTALDDGELANMHDFFPKTNDRSFDWQNGTTNRIAIVARDNLIEIYTNLVKIGEIDTTQPPKPINMPPVPLEPPNNASQAVKDFYEEQLGVYQQVSQQAQQNYQIANANYQKSKPIFTDGFLSMLAFTQGGTTECTFDNAWLWLLEP